MLFNLLDGGDSSTKVNNLPMLIVLGVVVAAMIGLLIWQSISGRKKQKEAQNMVNQLKKGDRVKTIGGVCGFVAEINDAENTFVLETGTDDNKSYVKFDKGAIYQTAPAQGNAVEIKEEPAPVVSAETEEAVSDAAEKTETKPKRTRKPKSAE